MVFDKNTKIDDLINDLAKNHHLIGVKSDFESEGSSTVEALYLKKKILNLNINLKYEIKIGGAEAVRDLYEAKTIGVDSILAPMIETPYALEKYINAIDTVFYKEEQNKIKFYINIETITGFNNLIDIVSNPLFDRISGIVLGLVDMSRSLGLDREKMFSEKMIDITKSISETIKTTGKEMIIGGGTCKQSLSLFSKVSNLLCFETRKLIFNAKDFLNDTTKNNLEAFIKATEFEILWIQNKKEFGGCYFIKDEKRVDMLKSRLSLLEKNLKEI